MVFILDDLDERTRGGTTAAAMYFNLYSKMHLNGQATVYAIWGFMCGILVFINYKPFKKLLAISIFSFFVSNLLHFVRYILILNDIKVRPDYRYESAVALLFERVGILLLLVAIVRWLPKGRSFNVFCCVATLPLFCLQAAYVIRALILSESAIYEWNNFTGIWRLKDRDLGYSMTPSMIDKFKGDQRWTWADFTMTRKEELMPYEYIDTQIVIGVVTDVVMLLFVLVLGIASLTSNSGLKESYKARKVFVRFSVMGLSFSALFRLVVTVHFVLGNWMVVRDENNWQALMSVFKNTPYDYTNGIDPGEYAPSYFVTNYRPTVEGFPVIQAVLEPVGIIFAYFSLVLGNRERGKLVKTPQEAELQPVNVKI